MALTKHLAEIISLTHEFKEEEGFYLQLTKEEFQAACRGINYAARTPTWFYYEDYRYGFFPSWDSGGLKTLVVWTHEKTTPFNKRRVGVLFCVDLSEQT